VQHGGQVFLVGGPQVAVVGVQPLQHALKHAAGVEGASARPGQRLPFDLQGIVVEVGPLRASKSKLGGMATGPQLAGAPVLDVQSRHGG
jgi:hypothetical protein